jgi:hypothetical protein
MAFVGGLMLTIAGGIILGVVGLFALPVLLAGLLGAAAKFVEVLNTKLDGLDSIFFLVLTLVGVGIYLSVKL